MSSVCQLVWMRPSFRPWRVGPPSLQTCPIKQGLLLLLTHSRPLASARIQAFPAHPQVWSVPSFFFFFLPTHQNLFADVKINSELMIFVFLFFLSKCQPPIFIFSYQVRRCARGVPLQSPFTQPQYHPSTVWSVATCCAAPACRKNQNHRPLLLRQHPVAFCVRPAAVLPHAVTSCVCITDRWRWHEAKLDFTSN